MISFYVSFSPLCLSNECHNFSGFYCMLSFRFCVFRINAPVFPSFLRSLYFLQDFCSHRVIVFIAAAAHGAVDEESFIRQFEDVPKVNVSFSPCTISTGVLVNRSVIEHFSVKMGTTLISWI